ncbi:hypothetical protein PAPYR_1567 [Paratrimastix pyriformis]|uniref:AN1-type domain-containing protein n=1 Tax=Paratrimastix pyriformis TaxID=342808 RepID=A0ABQ8UVV5_9EUKA|nr:hypothetical protein PAPYR_1567 [Paratrimastix pyriformis]
MAAAQTSRPRCAFCETPITLLGAELPCRCGDVFCDVHRSPEMHHCPDLLKRPFRIIAPAPPERPSSPRPAPPILLHSPTDFSLLATHGLATAILCYGLLSAGFTFLWTFSPRAALLRLLRYVALSVGCAWFGHFACGGATCPPSVWLLGNHPLADPCLWTLPGVMHPIPALRREELHLRLLAAWLLSYGRTNCITERLYGNMTWRGMYRTVTGRLREMRGGLRNIRIPCCDISTRGPPRQVARWVARELVPVMREVVSHVMRELVSRVARKLVPRVARELVSRGVRNIVMREHVSRAARELVSRGVRKLVLQTVRNRVPRGVSLVPQTVR